MFLNTFTFIKLSGQDTVTHVFPTLMMITDDVFSSASVYKISRVPLFYINAQETRFPVVRNIHEVGLSIEFLLFTVSVAASITRITIV